ncbi:hypothetical protein [Salmonirosea aquatica]|uniref:Uncharacterized protein n=1 Tax=Salmonirosea aquatica TaxID=2654236 RepID=A0A7C9FB25_9BACT|nr:hypothetical protein [Cytophagaceae bacterium SJW1-29]
MDTTEMKEFVEGIALLWKENKRRELLYIHVMKRDHLGNLRRLCNQGHISALLFQKEIQWIYDYFKCNLNDCDLRDAFEAAPSDHEQEAALDTMKDTGMVVRLIKEAELTTIRGYQSVLKYVDLGGEVHGILREHLDRLTHLCTEFGREANPYFRRMPLSPLYS